MKTTTAIISIIVVIVLIIGAYFIGTHHVMAPTATSTPATTVGTSTASASGSTTNYYQNTSSWLSIRENQAGFTLKYPTDFQIDENNTMTPSTDWRLNSQNPGIKVLTITMPSAFDPQTNFVGATFTVGYSQNNTAIADCLTPDPSGLPTATSSVTINGIQFTKFTSDDAGAGQLYNTTSYRTLHAGACYAVEYTIHSGQLGNYPASENLHQYDSAKITDVLDRIVGTFSFL